MNELLEQFLLESQELVEQASRSLLALEARPDDREQLDTAFRAVHTLKGGAGIVDFTAMAQALHAAEDALAAIRAGTTPITAELVSDCLACLDQVLIWLGTMEADGQPPAGADAEAEAIQRRFGRAGSPHTSIAPPAAPAIPGAWAMELLARHPEAAAAARTALRYTPDRDCFFRGEDPLALVAGLPGLLALEIAPAGEWPALEELDPFACHLILLALISGPAEQAGDLLHRQRGQCEILPLHDAVEPVMAPAARALLEAQLLLLADAASAGSEAGTAGRLASAGKVAANVLRHSGRAVEAGSIERALAECEAAGDSRPLAAAIGRAFGHTLLTTATKPAPRMAQDGTLRALRVDPERVETLVKLTGELAVAKNALGHAASQAQNGVDPKRLAVMLKEQHVLFERLVGELQRSVLSIRIVPLHQIFRRFPRLVREMALDLGRPTRLITEGDATEADKVIVEALAEPLLHVLRNALDHGVETPAERAALGKPATATIHLRAAREGDQIIIEVEDDGRGIDAARLREAAAERRLASAEALAGMEDAAVVDLIFAPGFSTAAEVTGISGRGVGMDAVRTAVEQLGGRVTVKTRSRQGTVVRFSLPFTLIMARVMTVESGGQLFGIALDVVAETARIARADIHPLGAGRVFVLRNQTVPLVSLDEALGRACGNTTAGDANVVVASLGGQKVGLEVDRLGDQFEVMLKPAEGLLAGLRGIAGTTLLGDGRVLIVLDLPELLQ